MLLFAMRQIKKKSDNRVKTTEFCTTSSDNILYIQLHTDYIIYTNTFRNRIYIYT